jgi:protein-S-isoprenylcysteine O-methyltransferase Ste14
LKEKFVANSVSALALLCGILGLVLFVGFPLGSLGLVRMRWSEAGVLWWDGLVSFGFFLQHSGMVRRQFRTRVYGPVPPRYRRALYSIASGITLAAVALLWQPSSNHLLVLGSAFRWVAVALAICAIALFMWGALALRKLDLLGTRAAKAHAQNIENETAPFIVSGPYRWVRHPWYVAAIMLFWSCVDFTSDRLLFNMLWTGWVCLGTRLEETDLVHEFGDVHEKYRRRVPMLVPLRRPVKTQFIP